MKTVRIGLIQTRVKKNVEKNVSKTTKLIGRAADKGAGIICLQELFQTPYFPQRENMNKDDYAETVRGYTMGEMKKAARNYGVTLIVPMYHKVSGKYLNTAFVVNKNGKVSGQYHKTHIPHDPGFYEKSYFDEGSTGVKIFSAEGIKFSVLICYDQWFPEAARLARLGGAEIIFYPTAIGNFIEGADEDDWHDAWETVQRGHAISNSLYIAAINRVGVEGNIDFWGQSFVCDPFGKILKRASSSKQEILITELDLSMNDTYAEGWGFLENRRPDTYGAISESTKKKPR